MYDEKRKKEEQREDREILQLLEMLSQLPETPVPDEFDLRLHRALKQERTKKKTASWKKWTAVAACLLIGLLSIQMIWGGVGSDKMNDMAQNTESTMDSAASYSEAGIETRDGKEQSGAGAEKSGEITAQGGGAEADLSDCKEAPAEKEDSEAAQEKDPVESAYGSNKNTELFLSADNSTDGGISRGGLASESQRAFEADCEQTLSWIAQSVADNDSQKLAAAMNYKNDLNYSQESAQKAMKLYGDLFDEDEGELTYGRVNLTAWSNSNVYRLSDGARELLVVVSNTQEGIKVSEPVIDKAQWLYDQIGDREFTLLDVICEPDGKKIEFRVNIEDEIRSFVWNEKES